MIRAGVDVTIKAPGMPPRQALVERLDTIAELPQIDRLDGMAKAMGYADSADAARNILAHAGFSRIATIRFPGAPAGVLIFEIHGRWVDQGGRPLALELRAVS